MPKSLNIVVLVSGRGSNLQAIIDATRSSNIKSRVKLVISNKDGVLAVERAMKADIPVKVIPSKGKPKAQFHDELLAAVKNQNPDLIVLAGFMKILSSNFVQTFKNRIINIHPAILPSFPGLDAQKQAIDAGVKITGCTVHYVDEGCDTGPIILQKSEEILPADTVDSLSERLLKKEHTALIEAIKLIEDDKVVLLERKTLLRDSV